jgi:hypothetical protein
LATDLQPVAVPDLLSTQLSCLDGGGQGPHSQRHHRSQWLAVSYPAPTSARNQLRVAGMVVIWGARNGDYAATLPIIILLVLTPNRHRHCRRPLTPIHRAYRSPGLTLDSRRSSNGRLPEMLLLLSSRSHRHNYNFKWMGQWME